MHATTSLALQELTPTLVVAQAAVVHGPVALVLKIFLRISVISSAAALAAVSAAEAQEETPTLQDRVLTVKQMLLFPLRKLQRAAKKR